MKNHFECDYEGGCDAQNKKTKVGTSIAGSDSEQSAIDFECPEEFGYYPSPTDCTRYYVCVFGGALLESWKGDDANEVDTLLAYDEDTAGGIMSPHVFALSGPTTCREAIETLQASHEDIEMAF